jgi:hypothetical protein
MGAAEVLMAYLGDEITANGGKGDFDLNIGKNKIEVKMVNFSPKGYMSNFRLGVNSFTALEKAKEDLMELVSAARFVKGINTSQVDERIAKGEIPISWINALRDVDVNSLQGRADFSVTSRFSVILQNQSIGNIDNKKTISFIKDVATKKKPKNISERC